jgi:capsular polysaccharide biosynthesis protein
MQPVIPQPRGLLLIAAASGVGGLVLGIAVAFVLEFFNLTVKDEQDVERFLQVPVLATIRHF